MQALFRALAEEKAAAELAARFEGGPCSAFVYGMSGAWKHAIFAMCYDHHPQPTVLLVQNQKAAAEWREDFLSLLPGTRVVELPALDNMQVNAAARSMERAAKRMEVLARLMRKENVIVLATAEAAVQKGMSRKDFERLSVHLEIGDVMERETLLARLVDLGYESVPEVETRGQFSARGGIVDVFSIHAEHPARIEFFDDEIDSLRAFDLETKRSLQNIGKVDILPVAQTDAAGKPELFLSYLDGKGAVLIDEPLRVREAIRTKVKENPELKGKIYSWENLVSAAEGNRVFYLALLLQQVHGAELDATISITATAMTPFQRQMDLLESEAGRWLGAKQRVLILLGTREKAESLREFFARKRIPSLVVADDAVLRPDCLNLAVGTLIGGFELTSDRLVVVTEKDIFGHQKHRRVTHTANTGERISHFREIRPGDYVVHEAHGIGKYLGVVTLEVGGVHKDYLHIQYGGDDKLYVPTDQVQLLQKYIGAEGEVPRLSRMGGTEWTKAKNRARKSVEDIAKKLIEIYAKRKDAEGFAFSPDDASQREFEDAFPYQETEDQLRAAAEIKADMEKPRPMDRLLCGDVGFGKTEVAIRAAYKAVMDGKQVAVLVPTTVLAMQHYQTFSERFHGFLPTVDVICRFRTPKEQKATLEKVEQGDVDILIGTHAILNQKKVHFKDLGLLIVDEEQRFGVKQKDKIRGLAAGLDVLTLSATPIPRTLHMSLVGARDMSLIETAPAERFPVQTYVVENNDQILQNAIRREIKRGGQIYFIYDRVATIGHMRDRLKALVPEARIGVAHGQMPEEILESVMMDFYEGNYDVLLATSIVENGLDVANANTIIVYNADHFGLSQLYQMRGRVGRSHHMAFAYFVYQADKVLTETAEKRLHAMKEFAELGAGFKIAMRDLEIRGAGNLLGAQQHGHIASVGFEMYCKLLEEAVERLQKGKEAVKEEEKPEPLLTLTVEAYLDGGYIVDAMHKIEIYQRIAAIRTNEEIRNLLDELIDRFGEPTKPVMHLLEIARIKNYARDLYITSIKQLPKAVDFTFLPGHRLKVQNLVELDRTFGKSMKPLAEGKGYRFILHPKSMANITNAVTRILMLMAEDDGKGSAQKEENDAVAAAAEAVSQGREAVKA